MVFVDSNVPMYLVGGPHEHKDRAARLLRRLVDSNRHIATDAEVLQEILHRYHEINRHDAIGPAFAVLTAAVDSVLPITADDVQEARRILETRVGLSARDAIHAAIMIRYEMTEILTFDSAFDLLPGFRRIS